MKISILTLFPEMFAGPFDHSIVKRAQEKGLVEIQLINIRDFGLGKHNVVDDRPFGGGVGMVMRVDVIDAAISATRNPKLSKDQEKVVLLDARGETFNQPIAKTLSQLEHLIILCGHYEGVDERVRDFVDMTISIGDFILTGGELPAMTITDAVARLVTGVLKEDATTHESFTKDLLEYPQYTLPRTYKEKDVPGVLVSGNHAEIDAWKKDQATTLTKKHRPDLIEK